MKNFPAIAADALHQLLTSLRLGTAGGAAYPCGALTLAAMAGGRLCVYPAPPAAPLDRARQLMAIQYQHAERHSEVQVTLDRASRLCLIVPLQAAAGGDPAQLHATLLPALRLLAAQDGGQ
jgi:hypothetical protein